MSPCHANATCNNTEGSYTCTCNTGYSGDGVTCDGKLVYLYINLYKSENHHVVMHKIFSTIFPEINECVPVSPCHANATCNNTDGSYTCTCNTGYSGDGIICDGKLYYLYIYIYLSENHHDLIDKMFFTIFPEINECVPVSPCHANGTCNNTEGSYTCTCNTGYSGDGVTCDGKLYYL